MREIQPGQETSYSRSSSETDDSKKTAIPWLGRIPADWTVSKVKWQFDVQLGKMLDEDAITGEELAPYLRNKDVQWWDIHTEDLPEMDFSPAEKRKYDLQSGDVLVCEGGEIGRSAVWTSDDMECYYQKALHRVRPISEVQDSRFFCYFMEFAAKEGLFVANTNRSTIDHLTAIKLKNQEIPVPPSEEQERIVDFLDHRIARIDTLVEKQNRLLDLLDEKRQAVITQAVTKGLDSTVATKLTESEWLSEIPEHWDITRLKYLRDPFTPIVYGIILPGPDRDNGVTIIKGGDCEAAELDPDSLSKTTEEKAAEYQRSRLHAGDLVYEIRGSVGRVVKVPFELEGANITQDTARIAPREGVSSDWLIYALRSDVFREQMDLHTRGATVQGVNLFDLRRGILPVPPLEEQHQIARYLEKTDEDVRTLHKEIEKSIDLLEEKRQALITAAVTGQIDVTEEHGEIQDSPV